MVYVANCAFLSLFAERIFLLVYGGRSIEFSYRLCRAAIDGIFSVSGHGRSTLEAA